MLLGLPVARKACNAFFESTRHEAVKVGNVKRNDVLVVWTSGDRDVALKMVFIYTANAKKSGWWDGVNLLVWGPSQKLLTEDQELQGRLAEMLDLGVRVEAARRAPTAIPSQRS